jgi:hypothetical protein
MPTGDTLTNLSHNVNRGIKAQQKYAYSMSPFHTMSKQDWESLEVGSPDGQNISLLHKSLFSTLDSIEDKTTVFED